MTGGDRVAHRYHGYASCYSQFLRPFLGGAPVLAEIGILKGTGLAIWCDLFPRGRIVGLDYDTSHFHDNLVDLHDRGAFRSNEPETQHFDAYVGNSNLLGEIFPEKVNLVIDDGPHTVPAIIETLRSFRDHLADNFVYFIEDNISAIDAVRVEMPEFMISRHGGMIVVQP